MAGFLAPGQVSQRALELIEGLMNGLINTAEGIGGQGTQTRRGFLGAGREAKDWDETEGGQLSER